MARKGLNFGESRSGRYTQTEFLGVNWLVKLGVVVGEV